MHLILTGATGLVGSGVVDAMLKSKEITKISILSRRPVPLAANDPRANVIIHKDFENYEPELLNKLQGANGVVWALGISQLKVTKEFVYLIYLELNRVSQADDLELANTSPLPKTSLLLRSEPSPTSRPTTNPSASSTFRVVAQP